MAAPQLILDLIARFERNYAACKTASYKRVSGSFDKYDKLNDPVYLSHQQVSHGLVFLARFN
jgi:hypothetical protein